MEHQKSARLFAQQLNKKLKSKITITNSLLCFSSDLLVALPSSSPLLSLSGLISPRFCFLHCPSIFLLLSFNQTPLSFLISSCQECVLIPGDALCLSFSFIQKTKSVHVMFFMLKSIFLPWNTFSPVFGKARDSCNSDLGVVSYFGWNKAENNGQQAAISFPRTNLISGFHS